MHPLPTRCKVTRICDAVSPGFIFLCSPTARRTLCPVSGLGVYRSPLLGSHCASHSRPWGGEAQGSMRHTARAGEYQRRVLSAMREACS